MNISLFTDSYLPTRDGVVSSILAYRRGLMQKGHNTFIFAPEIIGAKKEKNVFRFKSVRFPPYPEYQAAIFPHVSQRVASDLGIDIVHCKAITTMGLSAVWFSSRAKLPSVASLETLVPDGMHYLSSNEHVQKIGKSLAWSYLRMFFANFDIVTSPSCHASNMLRENKIESIVLPSPVDTLRFRPMKFVGNKIKRRLGLAGKKIVLSVGRVVKEKNYSMIIKAAKRIRDKDIVFLIVGKGPYLDNLKSEAKKHGVQDRFFFAGFVPNKNIVAYYNSADAFVFPSKFETQGLTLLEAFACGKPACVMAQTPMEEIIRQGKNGYVFQNEEECAESLLECISKGKSLTSDARKTALSYSIPKCTDNLLSLYNRLL